jgi:CubicO group peptidase (beta-lactamase class C family)
MIKLNNSSFIVLLILFLGIATSEGPFLSAQETIIFNKTSTKTQTEQDWEYTSFSEEGLNPTRFELLKKHIHDGTFKNVDSLVVVKAGKILIEEYFNDFDRNTLHEIRSATKSIGSALMGIAIDHDYVSGIQDKLYSYFPNRKPFKNWDVRKNDITIEHVLNMTTGFDSNDMSNSSEGNESNLIQAADIIQFMLDLPMVKDPGKQWAYSTGSAHLIGAIIENAADISVQEFARSFLFEPLHITRYRWNTAGGIAHTGGGFWMLPLDMAKFGQLYLNKGFWKGKEIISKEWIDESIKTNIKVAKDLNDLGLGFLTKVAKDLGHGFLWWKRTFHIDSRPFSAIAAQGNGENYIFVFPDEELVVVLTGSMYNSISGLVQTSKLMNEYILPAVIQDAKSSH